MRRPVQNSYGFNPAHYHYGATASSSQSNTSSSPSPSYTGALDQVFGGHNPYTIPVAYDAQMHHFIQEPKPSYGHPTDVFSVDPFASDPEYQCIAPPELHFTPPPTFPPPQAQAHTTYHSFPSEMMEEHMLPNPSELPSLELPKRKGERALARLQRSVGNSSGTAVITRY